MLNKKSKFEKKIEIQIYCNNNVEVSFSEGDISDEEGEGIFAYAGQPHIDAVEVAALSRGVVSIPLTPPLDVVFLKVMAEATNVPQIVRDRKTSSQVKIKEIIEHNIST